MNFVWLGLERFFVLEEGIHKVAVMCTQNLNAQSSGELKTN